MRLGPMSRAPSWGAWEISRPAETVGNGLGLVMALLHGVARFDWAEASAQIQRYDDMVFSDEQVGTARERVAVRPGFDRSVAMMVFALLAVAALLPVLLTPIPPMVD